MSDAFNLRSFVENQIEKLSTPKTILLDKFQQTVDIIKLPFSSIKDTSILITTNEPSLNICPSESKSSSSRSSTSSNNHLLSFSFNISG